MIETILYITVFPILFFSFMRVNDIDKNCLQCYVVASILNILIYIIGIIILRGKIDMTFYFFK